MLHAHGIRISMSRTGNPWDNAACESFMKTLKYEEVYRSEYRDLADAHARIGDFLEDRSTTRSGCTRRWITVRPLSSSGRCCVAERWWRSRHEFSEAWGNLSMR